MTDIDRIRCALSFVSPDSRETWVAMGMAVKAELGSAGFDVWDGWSQASDRYQAAAAKAVWKSFKPGKVGIGSLFHEARRGGWREETPYVPPSHAVLEQRRRVRAAELAREASVRNRLADTAAARAAALWAGASASGSSPYLVRKGVEGESLRYLDDGGLVVPMIRYGEESALVGAQVIAADGNKRFLTGTAKQGSACRLGLVVVGAPVLVCEGLATGLTIRAATGRRFPVFVAFDAGNLLPVAALLRGLCPDSPLLVCADDDWQTQGNPGRSKARAVTRAVSAAHHVYPVFSGDRGGRMTDFNDLQVAEGLDAVARQLAAPLAYLGRLVLKPRKVTRAA